MNVIEWPEPGTHLLESGSLEQVTHASGRRDNLVVGKTPCCRCGAVPVQLLAPDPHGGEVGIPFPGGRSQGAAPLEHAGQLADRAGRFEHVEEDERGDGGIERLAPVREPAEVHGRSRELARCPGQHSRRRIRAGDECTRSGVAQDRKQRPHPGPCIQHAGGAREGNRLDQLLAEGQEHGRPEPLVRLAPGGIEPGNLSGRAHSRYFSNHASTWRTLAIRLLGFPAIPCPDSWMRTRTVSTFRSFSAW